MIVVAAFVLSAAHSHVVACYMQTFDLVMALPRTGDSQGGSAPSATQTLKDKVTQMESVRVVLQATMRPQNVLSWRCRAGKYILLISSSYLD